MRTYVANNAISSASPTFSGTAIFNMGGLEFWNAGHTVKLSHIDGGSGNFVNDRPDMTGVFLGFNAGKWVATATNTQNVFIGYLSGQTMTDLGSNANNTAVGSKTLGQASTISGMTAIGSQAMTNVTGSCLNDTAVGYNAMLNATSSCNQNTAVGYIAMQGAAAYASASNNTAVGANALGNMSSASGSTALGSQAGSVSGLAGNNNTFLGYQAGNSGTGSYVQSTALGYNAQITADHQIVLGTSFESQLVIRGVPYFWPSGLASSGMFGALQTDPSGNLAWQGDPLSPLAFPTISITPGGALSATNVGRVNIFSGSSSYSVTLPSAAANANKFIRLQMASGLTLTGLVTIAGNGSDKIDGAASRIMWANEVATLFCDGTNWTKISGKSVPMTCLMTRQAAFTIPTATDQTIPLDTATIDNTGLMADPSTNKRINIQRPGLYFVDGGAGFGGIGPSSPTQIAVKVGTTTIAQTGLNNSGTGNVVLNSSTYYQFTSGQYVIISVYQATGGNVPLLLSGNINFVAVSEVLQW